MKKIHLSSLAFALVSFFLFSCEKLFMESNPETTPTAIFEEYWKLVNEKFAMFEDASKNLDRTALYNTTKAKISDNMSATDLIKVLGSEITLKLLDGHSYLEGGGYYYSYDIAIDQTTQKPKPTNLDTDLISRVYLSGNNVKTSGKLSYTTLDNGNAGYIAYRSFDSEVSNELMNEIIATFRNTKGVIIDVRGNGGGDPINAGTMASYFTNTKVYAGYERFKTGPNPSDFTKSEMHLTPANSGEKYTKPVYVLTNIKCFSATTTLCYLLNPLPHVTFIGARTGGGSGSVADGYLANGWKWALSTSEFIDYKNNRLDDGFDPDIKVSLDTSNPDKDEIIEKALEEIRKQ